MKIESLSTSSMQRLQQFWAGRWQTCAMSKSLTTKCLYIVGWEQKTQFSLEVLSFVHNLTIELSDRNFSLERSERLTFCWWTTGKLFCSQKKEFILISDKMHELKRNFSSAYFQNDQGGKCFGPTSTFWPILIYSKVKAGIIFEDLVQNESNHQICLTIWSRLIM